MKNKRMSAEERRREIIANVAPLFARSGLNGVSTRQLAETSGVSEALLFRYFPDKKALFAAAGTMLLDNQALLKVVPQELPPSTIRLINSIHRLTHFFCSPEAELFSRQLGHSLLGEGRLADTFFQGITRTLLPSIHADLLAAHASGDLVKSPESNIEAILAFHLVNGLQLSLLPEKTIGTYRCPRFELVKTSTQFALRGLGLRQSVIDREYLPENLIPPSPHAL